MDGQPASRRTVVDGAELYWPNGLTVDVAESRFYWTDVKLKYVQSARLDGSDRRVVVGALRQPMTLTVHEQSVYWADWQTHAIYVCSKHASTDDDDHQCQPRVVAVDVHQSTGLRAYDPSRQPHGIYTSRPRCTITVACSASSQTAFTWCG